MYQLFAAKLHQCEHHDIDMHDSDWALALGYASDYGHGLEFNTSDFSDLQQRIDEYAKDIEEEQ